MSIDDKIRAAYATLERIWPPTEYDVWIAPVPADGGWWWGATVAGRSDFEGSTKRTLEGALDAFVAEVEEAHRGAAE